MFKRIIAILLAFVLCVGGIPFAVMADTGASSDGLTLVFEDNFDSYGKETAIAGTSVKDFFNSEANPVGNSFIRVVQDEGGNWYLKSVVFTEIFNAIPIVGSYAFSLDILGAGGAVSSGVFVRGLDTAPAFYEADSYPDASTTRSGLMLYPRADKLGVNVKTYDPNRTADNAFLKNNTVMFDLPAGVTYPYTLKVTDTSEEIAVYVNDTLICRITLSDPGKTYEKHDSDETCYGSAKLYAADGRELASYTDTLLDCDGALFGWATRASDISVDNVRVWIGKAQQTVQAIGKIPTTVTAANLNKATELATAARALYDSLSDAEKELIVNYDKLIDTETAIKAVNDSLDVKWSDPAYQEMETTEYDTAEGTLKYTLSEDGSAVTISYELNGETLSYTVPNNDNYLFGGYAATDDLGRSLYDSTAVGSYGTPEQERYIGLFYFLCMGEHGQHDKVVDLQKVLDQYGPESGAVKNDELYPEDANYWWGEPLYGYYYSNDTWVMRKHAELLTMADVDFLYIDVTNAFTYIHNAVALMEILHELSEQGFDAPQVVFYTNANSEGVIRQLYDSIYGPGLYPDTWFRINGKPVIIGPTNFDMDGFFTVKRSQWPTEGAVDNAWPWMDFGWPQRVYKNRNGDGSAISVSVAQHSGTVVFSDSSLYGDYTNRGRSYNNPTNISHRWSTIKDDYRQTLQSSYDAWLADQTLTMQGLNFQKQFDNAVESDATYVLVTGWNEWSVGNNAAAHNFRLPYFFTDCASMEFSRDAEMMRGGYFDNYYIQMTYNIQRLKGTAPIIVQDSRKPINVTGEFDQWNDVTVTYTDPENDVQDRNALGGGDVTYTNTSGRNDIVASKVTSDSKNLYVYVKTAHNISMFDADSSWMQIYLNTDRQSTGWYGYDFILNHKAKDEFTTTVAKYNGTDGGYGFETVGEVSYRVKGVEMMISVPLSLLGIEGYKEINVEFKIADSETVYDEMEDFYCDGDAAPLGRMNYIYQNYIPGVSVITYPESDTDAPTEEATTAPTTSDTDAATEPAEKKGCRSTLSGSMAIVALLPVAALSLRAPKKRKH